MTLRRRNTFIPEGKAVRTLRLLTPAAESLSGKVDRTGDVHAIPTRIRVSQAPVEEHGYITIYFQRMHQFMLLCGGILRSNVFFHIIS